MFMTMRREIVLCTALALLTLAAACGKKQVQLNPAISNPAATGRAELTTDRNGNTVVDLKVKHLAKPENLTPAKTVYVVWFQPRGGPAENRGALRVNEDLAGEYKGPTPYKSFDIFITAEDNPSVTVPTGTEVLRQTVMK